MKVFISWSGDLSRELGEAIRQWLPSVLQHVKPYFTPADVDKGAKWSTEIFQELGQSQIGIIVVTRESLASDWLMFEAGAISSQLDKPRVCPVIFNLEPTDLKGPLANFQSTTFKQADFRQLMSTINNAAGDQRLTDGVFNDVFQMWWPKLADRVKSILDGHEVVKVVTPSLRTERDLIEEILSLTRKLATDLSEPRSRQYSALNYDGTVYEVLMDIINYVYTGYTGSEAKLRKLLIEGKDMVQKRIPESDLRIKLVAALDNLIVLSETWKTPSSPKPRDKSGANDDIPF